MQLIPYSQFERLRLTNFYPNKEEIDLLVDWEYMDGMWIGEGVGFSTFLRPYNKPNCLGSIELDMIDLSNEVVTSVLQKVMLPLEKEMSAEQINGWLGPPVNTVQFVADRRTYEYSVGRKYRYLVSCTVHESQGLIFVGIMRQDMNPQAPTLRRFITRLMNLRPR